MSYDRDSLIKLFDKMLEVREKLFFQKGTLDSALKEWQKEDRLTYSMLREALRELDDIEIISLRA
jgi:uncharacterized protein YhfF